MHEGKIAQYVMEILEETVNSDPELKTKKISKITFSQGYPPSVVPDSFEFYFTELVRGTSFENAVLEYTELPDISDGGFYITSIETSEENTGGN
ncbi:MAG: hydrogenase maturation nickel metallochaperone HypA [Deltaproteobacteria bacterium]|nr:hydrogenase maturation nickel metallochaperone HypA [Deltaproteobacteria bacterium]